MLENTEKDGVLLSERETCPGNKSKNVEGDASGSKNGVWNRMLRDKVWGEGWVAPKVGAQTVPLRYCDGCSEFWNQSCGTEGNAVCRWLGDCCWHTGRGTRESAGVTEAKRREGLKTNAQNSRGNSRYRYSRRKGERESRLEMERKIIRRKLNTSGNWVEWWWSQYNRKWSMEKE